MKLITLTSITICFFSILACESHKKDESISDADTKSMIIGTSKNGSQLILKWEETNGVIRINLYEGDKKVSHTDYRGDSISTFHFDSEGDSYGVLDTPIDHNSNGGSLATIKYGKGRDVSGVAQILETRILHQGADGEDPSYSQSGISLFHQTKSDKSQ